MSDDRFGTDGFRDCNHCGCHTNAKLRRCCQAGYEEDIEFSNHRGRFAQGKRLGPRERLEAMGVDVDAEMARFRELLGEDGDG